MNKTLKMLRLNQKKKKQITLNFLKTKEELSC